MSPPFGWGEAVEGGHTVPVADSRRARTSGRDGELPSAFAAFEDAARVLAGTGGLDERLRALAEAAAAATHAETVVVRLLDPAAGALAARAVVSGSAALAAELEGSQTPSADAGREVQDPAELPEALRGFARLAGAEAVLRLPIAAGERLLGTLELLRARRPFDEAEQLLARLAASQAALLAGASGANGAVAQTETASLETLGDALAAAAEGSRLAPTLTRLAARASGAAAAVLWEPTDDGRLRPATTVGLPANAAPESLTPSVPQPGDGGTTIVRAGAGGLPGGAAAAVTIRLGDPPSPLLQLFLPVEPDPASLEALVAFGARAGQALRCGLRASRTAAELERTRALLAVVGQAIAELSLSHTLETGVARVAELLDIDRVAIYLRGHEGLRPAAERGLGAGHLEVADALLELALGPFRARGVLVVEDAAWDTRLAHVQSAVAEAGIEAAVAVPLVVADDSIGLLVAYLDRGRTPTQDEAALLTALAAQLGVAVQNAQLHEKVERESAERARALDSAQKAASLLRSFFEISQSFTRNLSLEETLSAVARAAVELLDADAGAIRTHDARRATLVTQAVHVAEERLAPVVEAILGRPQSLETEAAQALVEAREPVLLTPRTAHELGGSYELLAPFLERGGSAAIVPIASAGELMATLTVVSFDAERAIGQEALGAAASLAGHAVLAVDKARLYEQQKHFLEAMQQSLLPASLPDVPGLELGHAYESSARLEVGGDVYDFMPLDGRLAVVLGDVTGHGVEAAADMAMAKFVFRSLAREHSEPADFLAAANEVVVGELSVGKFITLAYLTVDGERGELRCASAGHPLPRLVSAGEVKGLGAGGVALGVDPGQEYEELRSELARGDAVVLYTDGVIEARQDGELYGEARLDAVLRAHAGSTAAELAAAVLAGCRDFAGGELLDDCAVVVVKRV